MRAGFRSWWGALTLVAVVAAGCSSAGDQATPASSSSTEPSTTTTTAPTTTTSTSTTVPAAPRIDAPGLGRGSRGDAVLALENRLLALHYDPGTPDGVYDASTQHAVMAFQKVVGLTRTGRATPDVLDALTTAQLPTALVPGGGDTRVEVDLKRQVLLLWKDGQLFRVVPVSTGSGKRYCVDGRCARAVTPGGSFRVSRRISGWRKSRLGLLYNPLYFNGGIAIHGAPSVPGYPASHGCVRIPMYVSKWFPAQVPNGTPVYVVGGVRAAVPFDEPAPGDTTTTSAPTPTTAPLTSTISGF